MSKNPLVVMSAKVDSDVKEQFDRAFEESGAATKNQFYEILIERFLNPKTKEVEVPTPTDEQTRQLEEKDLKIKDLEKQLETVLKNDDHQLQSLQKQVDTYEGNVNKLLEENEQLKNRPPEGLQLEENQVLVTFSPEVAFVLDHEVELARKKTGKDYSRAELLIRTFWTGIRKGASYPFKVWSDFEIKQIKTKIEKANPANQPAE